MLTLLYVAAVLLVLLGVVTMGQRIAEVNRRYAAAVEQRRRLAEQITRLQSETEFATAFKRGDAASLSAELEVEFQEISSAFAVANRKLDNYCTMCARVATFQATVDLARVSESYADVSRRTEALKATNRRLDETISRAKTDVERITNEWQRIHQQLGTLVGDAAGDGMLKEWGELGATLARLAVDTDDAARAAGLADVSNQVEAWESRLWQFATWREWKICEGSRLPVVTACLDRLKSLDATNSRMYEDLQEALADIEHMVRLKPEDIAGGQAEAVCRRLGPNFTGLVQRATQFLAMVTGPDALREGVQEELRKLTEQVSQWDSAEMKERMAVVHQAEPGWYTSFAERLTVALEAAKRWVAEDDVLPPSPRAAIAVVDDMLYREFQLADLRHDVSTHWSHWRRDNAALDARLESLARKLVSGREQLANAGLTESDPYRKLDRLQDEIRNMEQTGSLEERQVIRAERHVQEEIRIAEALVASRNNVDATLKEHLDRLVHQHPGRMSDDLATENERARDQLRMGDVGGAAWSSLMVAEAMLDVAQWHNWEDWGQNTHGA